MVGCDHSIGQTYAVMHRDVETLGVGERKVGTVGKCLRGSSAVHGVCRSSKRGCDGARVGFGRFRRVAAVGRHAGGCGLVGRERHTTSRLTSGAIRSSSSQQIAEVVSPWVLSGCRAPSRARQPAALHRCQIAWHRQ